MTSVSHLPFSITPCDRYLFPSVCSLGSFAAAWNVQLKQHAKAHLSPECKTCSDCLQAFKDQSALSKHMKKCPGYPPSTENGLKREVDCGVEKEGMKKEWRKRVPLVKTAVSTEAQDFRGIPLHSLDNLNDSSLPAENKDDEKVDKLVDSLFVVKSETGAAIYSHDENGVITTLNPMVGAQPQTEVPFDFI